MTLSPQCGVGAFPDVYKCPNKCGGKLVKDKAGVRYVCDRDCGTEMYVGVGNRPLPGIIAGPLVGEHRHPIPAPQT